jgi:hypothetical protein
MDHHLLHCIDWRRVPALGDKLKHAGAFADMVGTGSRVSTDEEDAQVVGHIEDPWTVNSSLGDFCGQIVREHWWGPSLVDGQSIATALKLLLVVRGLSIGSGLPICRKLSV